MFNEIVQKIKKNFKKSKKIYGMYKFLWDA